MPPLLAALLMMEFSCDLRIVQAIDLGCEWRQYDDNDALKRSRYWFDGWLGVVSTGELPRGTYLWPWPGHCRHYSKHYRRSLAFFGA
jgi:hypothetical protein